MRDLIAMLKAEIGPWIALLMAQVYMAVGIVTIALVRHGRAALRWTSALAKSVRINLGFLVINRLLAPVIGFSSAMGAKSAVNLGLPQVPEAFWQDVPLAARVFIALVMSEFLVYWAHRLLHTPWLWPVHAVHHSDRHMNMFTGDRAHILERMLTSFILAFGLFMASVPVSGVILVFVLIQFHDAYIHARLDIDHGPFNFVIASPRFHQWHHADDPAAYGKNLGILTGLWDLLFGTYYNPGKVTAGLGVKEVTGESLFALLIYPFKAWGRMARAHLGRSVSKPDIRMTES